VEAVCLPQKCGSTPTPARGECLMASGFWTSVGCLRRGVRSRM
jgi:hypothetical protein